MSKPKSRKPNPSAQDREAYSLAGPEDFDEYIQRIRTGKASPQEHSEFTLRIMQHFADSVWAHKLPEQWVMDYLADRFERILHGGKWEREFPLPWIPVPSDLSRAEERGLSMACEIENARRQQPHEGVTEIIERVAAAWNVSYETARANYYERRASFSRSRPEEIE